MREKEETPKPKPPLGKIKKMPPEALICPHCGKTITELEYTEKGYMRISDHNEQGGKESSDFPERIHRCPECGEEIEYEALEEAGVF